MRSRYLLALAFLCGTSASVLAQPHGQDPMMGHGPESMSFGGAPAGTRGSSGPVPGYPTMPESVRGGSWLAERQASSQARRNRNPAVQASATLKEGMDKLLAYLAQDALPNKLQVAAFLDREIAPYFDFDYMAQWVAGPAGARMSAEQRKSLVGYLESDFLTTLATQLAGYQGQRVRLLSPRVGPRGAVSINVAILRAGDYPATLRFRMTKTDSGWKVYDVVANGQSAAAYYRLQFQRMTAQGVPFAR